MFSDTSAGAQAYPMRNPVIAHAFDIPCRKIVRSFIPGTEMKLTCFDSYVSSA